MAKTLIIIQPNKIYRVNEAGQITSDNYVGSNDWLIRGAIEYGRGYCSGSVIRRYSLADIFENRVPWFYKNGKQRCYVLDYDHGANRVWGSPKLLSVYVIGK